MGNSVIDEVSPLQIASEDEANFDVKYPQSTHERETHIVHRTCIIDHEGLIAKNPQNV